MHYETKLTPKQCAEQFRMYAAANPSADSRFSMNFCAKFLDDFCTQAEETLGPVLVYTPPELINNNTEDTMI